MLNGSRGQRNSVDRFGRPPGSRGRIPPPGLGSQRRDVTLGRLTLAAIAVDVALIAIRVSSYRELLAMPGSVPFIVKPLIVLAVYFVAVIWMTSKVSDDRGAACQLALHSAS